MKTFIQRFSTSLVLGLSFWLSYIYFPPLIFSCILVSILFYIIAFEWVHFFSAKHFPFWIILPFYPVAPFMVLIMLNQNPFYHSLLLPLFVIVASYDTGSYLIGTWCGMHKLCPHISPHKTWEGTLGGFCFALAGIWFLVNYEQSKHIPLGKLGALTLLICAIALTGDLFESWLKRCSGIKHAGSALPGHGGFLDRFDGIMFAGIFFYLFANQLVVFFS